MTLNDIIEVAYQHAERLSQDVKLASTRIEHVRVTARANEAANLLHYLQTLTEETKTNEVQNGEPSA